MSYLPRAAGIALLIVLCFGLTTGAAAYAVKRPDLRTLETETSSRLRADYSRDPGNIKLRRLDPAIIEDASRDEVALLTTATPQRVTIAHDPTATPVPTDTPQATSTPPASPTARPSSTPPPSATPAFTATAPPPTASPVPPTIAPETVVPPDTATPAPKPTDIPVIEPTDTPEVKPTSTPIRPTPTRPPSTPTRTPSVTPTRTNTPQPADTVAPIPTSTHTPTATATFTPQPTATLTWTPTPTPSNTPVPTPTQTPTPTPTQTDTPAPTPTATQTPTATATPTPGPQTTTLSPQRDSFVEEASPTFNWGSDPELHVDGNGFGRERAYFDFNINSEIPGNATIESATLTLCMQDLLALAAGRTHALYRVTGGWDDSAITWNNQPAFSGSATDFITVPLVMSCVDFDVTADVQAWTDGTPNHGWVLKDAGENGGLTYVAYAASEHGTASQRPALTITYVP